MGNINSTATITQKDVNEYINANLDGFVEKVATKVSEQNVKTIKSATEEVKTSTSSFTLWCANGEKCDLPVGKKSIGNINQSYLSFDDSTNVAMHTGKDAKPAQKANTTIIEGDLVVRGKIIGHRGAHVTGGNLEAENVIAANDVKGKYLYADEFVKARNIEAANDVKGKYLYADERLRAKNIEAANEVKGGNLITAFNIQASNDVKGKYFYVDERLNTKHLNVNEQARFHEIGAAEGRGVPVGWVKLVNGINTDGHKVEKRT